MLSVNFPVTKKFTNGSMIIFEKPYHEHKEIQSSSIIDFETKYLHNIIGLNGLGKTTFMNIISLLTGFEGNYHMDENEQLRVNSLSQSSDKDKIRMNKFSYVFQDPHIINMYSIEENLQLVNSSFDFKAHFDEILERVEREITSQSKDYLMLKLRYLQKQRTNSPYYLSGGEKQLLSFIRALINPSNIIFADEPWASMDQKLKDFVENQLYLYLTNHDVFSAIRNSFAPKTDNVVVIITHMHHHKNNDYLGVLDVNWTKFIPVTHKKSNDHIEPGLLTVQRFTKSN